MNLHKAPTASARGRNIDQWVLARVDSVAPLDGIFQNYNVSRGSRVGCPYLNFEVSEIACVHLSLVEQGEVPRQSIIDKGIVFSFRHDIRILDQRDLVHLNRRVTHVLHLSRVERRA